MKRRSRLLALPIPWARLESLNAFNDLYLDTHSSERLAHISPASAGQSVLSFGIQAESKALRLMQASRTGDEGAPAGPQSLNAFNSLSGIGLRSLLLKSRERRALPASWTFSESLNAFNDRYFSTKTSGRSARRGQGYTDQSELFLILQAERSAPELNHTGWIAEESTRIGSQSLNAFNSPSGSAACPLLPNRREPQALPVSGAFTKSLNAFNDSHPSANSPENLAHISPGPSVLFLGTQPASPALRLKQANRTGDEDTRRSSQALNAFNDLYPRAQTLSLDLEACLTEALRLADRQDIDGTGQRHMCGLAPALNAFNARAAAIAGEAIPELRVSSAPAMDLRLGGFACVQNRKSRHGRSPSRLWLPCVECIQRSEVFCCSALFFVRPLYPNRGGSRMPDPPQ
jgi:hypothetical protein